LLLERGGRCDYSYRCSRSPSRSSRDVSPVSVGSSVLEDDAMDAGGDDGSRAGERRAAEDQPDAPSSPGSLEEPQRPAPAAAAASAAPAENKRRKVRRVRRKTRPQAAVEADSQAQADRQQCQLSWPISAEEIEDSEGSVSEPAEEHSARPLKSSRRSAAETAGGSQAAPQLPGAGAVALGQAAASTQVRRTAAKSAPSCPPATTTASSQALANPLEAELTEPEQQQLKVDILKQLRRHVQVKQDEAEVLAEFIFVLVDQKKSRTEMISELSLMNKEAVPFVGWLEKQKAQLLAARPPPASAKPAVVAASPPPAPPPPPPPPSGADMAQAGTPHASSTEQQGSSKRRSDRRGAFADDDALVVITERLVLQPNREHGAAAAAQVRELTPEQKKMEEANQKKLELIGEMTKKLQVILHRLSDKTLDDATKERYQSLAQTIQTQMSTLSPKNPVVVAAEKESKAAAAAAAAGTAAEEPS